MQSRHPKAGAALLGRPWPALVGVLAGIAWLASGVWFRFSAAWQVVVNMGCSAILMLMILLLRERQNRANKAVQDMVDEAVRLMNSAQSLRQPDFESMPESEVRRLHEEYRSLAEEARHALDSRKGKLTGPTQPGGPFLP